LNGDGEHALTVLNARRLLGRAVPEEPVDRCQPDVARGHEVVPVTLQMLEEVQDLRGAAIIEIQLAHGSGPSLGNKAQEEHEAIPIC
jgi:hypothetical protein